MYEVGDVRATASLFQIYPYDVQRHPDYYFQILLSSVLDICHDCKRFHEGTPLKQSASSGQSGIAVLPLEQAPLVWQLRCQSSNTTVLTAVE